jgi:hypothetical protein
MIEILPKSSGPEFTSVGSPLLGRMFAIAGDRFVKEFARVAASKWRNSNGVEDSKQGVAEGLALRRGAAFVTTRGTDLFPHLDSHQACLAAGRVLARRDLDGALLLFHGISKRYSSTRSALAGVIARAVDPKDRVRLADLLRSDDYARSAAFVDAIADARRGLSASTTLKGSTPPNLVDAIKDLEAGGVGTLRARNALQNFANWREERWRGAPIRYDELRRRVLTILATRDFPMAIKIAFESESMGSMLRGLRVTVGAWLRTDRRDGGVIALWDEVLRISNLPRTGPKIDLLRLAVALELVASEPDAVIARLAHYPDLIAAFECLVDGVEPALGPESDLSFDAELLLAAAKQFLVREIGERDPLVALQRIPSLAKSETNAEGLIYILFDVWPLPNPEAAFIALKQLEQFVATYYPEDPSMNWRIVTDARDLFAVRLAPWASNAAVELVREQKDIETRERMLADVIKEAVVAPADYNLDWRWWSEVANTITDEQKRAESFAALLAAAKRTQPSAAAAMPDLVGYLSAGARRSFLQGVQQIAELAVVAAPAQAPNMLGDLERITSWFQA